MFHGMAPGRDTSPRSRPCGSGELHRDRPTTIIFQVNALIIGAGLNMSSDRLENSVRPAADRFLVLLKMRGPQTAADLGKATGRDGGGGPATTRPACGRGADCVHNGAAGVGRPAQVWGLTEAGNARFPDSHAELTAQLIRSIRTRSSAKRCSTG